MIQYKIVFTRRAREDELDAFNYYEKIREGLGEDFLQVLENIYAKISTNPYAYSFIDKRKILRDVKIERFPYVIIFEIIDDTVFVYTVHNTNKVHNL